MPKKNEKHATSSSVVLLQMIAAIFVTGGTSIRVYASDLAAYWHLDEVSGFAAYDSAGYGNNGTLEQPNPTENNWRPNNGIAGGALDCSNVRHVKFDNPKVGESQNGTFETWFNLNNTNTAQAIFSKVYNSDIRDGEYFTVPSRLLKYETHRLRFTIYSGYRADGTDTRREHFVETDPAETGDFVSGQWYHVAVTWGSRGMEIWLDGQLRASNNYAGYGEASDDQLVVGDDLSIIFNVDSFEGHLDEVAIFNEALSPNEILQHYDNGLQGAHYEIDDEGAIIGEKVDIMLLLDCSGSMRESASSSEMDRLGSKIKMLQHAANQFIRMMKATKDSAAIAHQRLGIIKYNHRIIPFEEGYEGYAPLSDLFESTKVNKSRLVGYYLGSPDGLTSIGNALREALNQFLGVELPYKRNIVLISDGKENTSEWIKDVEQDLRDNDVTVYCLGLGYEKFLNKDKLVGLAGATGGLWSVNARHIDCRKMFVEALCNVLDEQFEQCVDPIVNIVQGESVSIPVPIASMESSVTITAFWEAAPDAVTFELVSPSGRIISPATSNARIRYVEDPYYVFYRLDFPLEGDLASEWQGQWQAVVKRPESDPNSALKVVPCGISAFVEGGAEFNVELDRQSHLTGDVVKLKAELVFEKELLTGYRIDVYGDVPTVGLGNVLHDNYVDPAILSQEPNSVNGDLINESERKLRILNEQAGEDVLKRMEAEPFQLYDDGLHGDREPNDGIYANSFTETQTQGSYTFRFVASEIPVGDGLTTTREWTRSFYTSVRIDPNDSLLSVQQSEVTAEGIKYNVNVVPRDRFGNYLEPGHDVTVGIVHIGGIRRIPLKDNVDGTYSDEILVTHSEIGAGAQFEVYIDGEPFGTPIDPTLIAHWTLDETDGPIAYDSVGVNDATVFGNALWQPGAGRINGALEFDGIDDYVNTPPVLNPAAGPFTVIIWIKGGTPGQVILSQQDGANWLLADRLAGTLVTELNNFWDVQELQSDILITDNNWHSIRLMWDGSERTLFVDGVQVAVGSLITPMSSDAGLHIGAGKNTDRGSFWSGLIDDIKVYSRVVRP